MAGARILAGQGSDEEAGDPLDWALNRLADEVGGLKGDDLRAYEDLEFYAWYVTAEGNPEMAKDSKFLETVYHGLQHTDKNLLIIGPRGSAKSTAVSVNFVTWALGRNPSLRFMLTFASKDAQGLAFMRQIKFIIEKNDRYKKIFGTLKPRRPEKWTDDEIIVNRRTPPGGLKDPSVAISGVGTAIPSKRADIIICDDIVTMDDAFSELKRARVRQFYFQTLLPILTPTGRSIFVGSRWEQRDLYAAVSDEWGLSFPKSVRVDREKLLNQTGLSQDDLIDEDDSDATGY